MTFTYQRTVSPHMPKFNAQDLYFVPLGGAGEIGMNLNLYHYQGKWLMVDLGITFGDGLGIEVITPDPSFIVDKAKDLLGLVITHGHEDHIGAIPYLWDQLRCPIYASPFTMELIRAKLKDVGLLDESYLRVTPVGSTFEIGPFGIEFITVTHSIPEPSMIAIRTNAGTILHTGDWKFDADPVLGVPYDTKRLTELGQEGVLALVCDSTNVFEKGWSGTEYSTQEALVECMEKYPDSRIVVACFSSNVARLKSTSLAAIKHNRSVAVAGRSMKRIDAAARQSGYLKNIPPFLDDNEGMSLSREKVVFLCTGSQGEDRAALSRIARRNHPSIQLDAGDVVIFSSRVIPGNEKDISRLKNLLVEQGVIIVTSRDADIHVSGHPCQDELAELYKCVKPKIAVPVHGEIRHMIKQAELARQWSTPFAIVPHNGDVIRLNGEVPMAIGRVKQGQLAMDGGALIDVHGPITRDRRQLSENGVVFVTLSLPSKDKSQYMAKISTSGLMDDDEEWQQVHLKELVKLLKKTLNDLKPNKEEKNVADAIRGALKGYFKREFNKRPYIMVHSV